MTKKQRPPKKMTEAERKVAAKKNSDAIQGKTKASKEEPVALPKPYVFLDRSKRAFLLLTEEPHHNRYLTLGQDGVQVVKLQHAAPVRNEKGFLPEDTTSAAELTIYEDYELKKAAQKFYDSFLARTPDAERELCAILGKPVPDLPVEVVAKRAEKVERMKKVREVLAISRKEKAVGAERQVMTSSGFPTSVAVVTLVKGATAKLDEARQVLVSSLKKAGGSLTISELRKVVGKPVGTSVMKLVELGCVTLS